MSLLRSPTGRLANLSTTTTAPARMLVRNPSEYGDASATVSFPDVNLRTAVEEALGKTPGDAITRGELARLERLVAPDREIAHLTGLECATALKRSVLTDNPISDASPLAGLTALTRLSLEHNRISDVYPLVANTGPGTGDRVYLFGNPLSAASRNTHIPALRARGVEVFLNQPPP